jgi:hypothetical protein
MNTPDMARIIRDALERTGYELVLRQMAPRTDIGKRNLEERTHELAREITRRMD